MRKRFFRAWHPLYTHSDSLSHSRTLRLSVSLFHKHTDQQESNMSKFNVTGGRKPSKQLMQEDHISSFELLSHHALDLDTQAHWCGTKEVMLAQKPALLIPSGCWVLSAVTAGTCLRQNGGRDYLAALSTSLPWKDQPPTSWATSTPRSDNNSMERRALSKFFCLFLMNNTSTGTQSLLNT